MKNSLQELHYRLNSLVIFRDVMNCRTIQSLERLLESLEDNDTLKQLKAYSDFVSNLYRHHNDLSSYILTLILEDENIYMIRTAHRLEISQKMKECLFSELESLQMIAEMTSLQVKDKIAYDGFLPDWDNTYYDFKKEYLNRIDNIERYGYGIYAKYYMFIVKDSRIVPVKYPDEVKLSQLIGYEKQRQLVIDNTLALINGKPASNVLLSGDAGTGKSSSVKAIANEFRDKGLRIIEIRKDQLREIPEIIDGLSKNPLKFILFIDDLSFAKDDDNFGALKAILEGSVSARANNIVIYATSNRRHLVKESFSDRDGDDVHRNDTVQELISLSERFGLRITFSKPNKYEYLEIVKGLAKLNSLDMSEEELEKEAERFAVGRSGRSARAAKQFIDKMIAAH
ncbi:ATP-binding protein [Porcipelethomonas sp.]|mgnify:FL=1|uniref:ATP-binding protein n=1 Tax=Porcipelethomonas sp. TaxID=2981675 RepID=UPI003079419E